MIMETKTEDTAIIAPEDFIDITNSHRLWDSLMFLCDAGFKEIWIDFTHVGRIDCSGLGKILLAQKRLKESRGGLKLINVTNPFVRKFFALVQVEKVIPVENKQLN